MSIGIQKIRRRFALREEEAVRQVEKAAQIYEGANPVQRALIDDRSLYIGGLCPRRSGKTFAVTSKALHLGESRPNSRVLIISLTLKSTVENYWNGSPGGLWAQNHKYGLELKFNTTAHTWYHQNGSRGILAGAETKADIEHLRGAAAEADLVIIDECKSFAPSHLQDLIENVIEPGLMTRNGQLVLIGTPGSLPLGPFYHATCLAARLGEGDDATPTCILYKDRTNPPAIYARFSPDELEDLYSLHTWTIEDNIAVPGQWARALRIKRQRGWDDDNPTWRREFLGQWVSDASDLVYSWIAARAQGKATWEPDPKFGKSGLDPAEGPWHILLGLDIGFVDSSAMVLVAWSETVKELRQIDEFKRSGLDAQAFIEEVLAIVDEYGPPEAVVADFGGSGARMIVETLNQRYGQAIQAAQKRDKNDYIELLNGDFLADRVKIIPQSELAVELEGLQWDLSNNAKHILARTGRLREDPSCPNHLCDALLYIWRFAYHFFSVPNSAAPAPGTLEYAQAEEEAAIARYIARRRQGRLDPHGLSRVKETPLTRESLPGWMPSTSPTSKTYSTGYRPPTLPASSTTD